MYPDRLFVTYADATDENSLKAPLKRNRAIRRFDIAIHNACMCTFKSEPETDYEVYRQVMDVNYYGALRLAKLILPEMRKAERENNFTSSESA